MNSPWFVFPSPCIFRASGKDVRRYLHNRLSQDLRACTPNTPIKAAALTAQGRVEGLFVVFCDEQDTFYLACDGGKKHLILAALSRFIVADRVSLQDCSVEATWCHIASDHSSLSQLCEGTGARTVFTIPNPRIGEVGTDILFLGDSQSEIIKSISGVLGPSLSEWEYNIRRFRHGVAAYPSEINEEMILTEYRARDAVSFTKGCYVGQEVLERSDALGKLPRLLERIVFSASESPPQIGDSIASLEGTSLGKVTSVFEDKETGRIFVFALLRNGKYNYNDAVRCDAATGTIIPQQLILS